MSGPKKFIIKIYFYFYHDFLLLLTFARQFIYSFKKRKERSVITTGVFLNKAKYIYK